MSTETTPEVIGIGLCTVDLLFLLPQPPSCKGTMRAAAHLRQGGGPVPTALVTLARLGASTRFIARIGDDGDGAYIREEFEREGVDTSRLLVEADSLTRVTLVLVDQETGERGFTTRPDTCAPLAPEDIDPAEIAAARLLHLDDADEPCMQAAKWAQEAGTCVVFDGTWMHEKLEEFLPLVDVPIVSEPFVDEWMPGTPPAAVVERLCDLGAKVAVFTLGAKGCVARWDEKTWAFPSFPIEVVDTTGAGDAFHGGFIYGLLQEWEVEETIRFASAVAALNCRQLGGRTGLPTREAVEDFLADSGGFQKIPLRR